MWDGICTVETVRSNRKQVPNGVKIKASKNESDFHYSKSIICCKWYESKLVLLLATNVEGTNGTSNIMRQTKGVLLVLTSSSFTTMTWVV